MTDTAELRSICAAADIAPAEGSNAPEWVELLPTGQIKGRDGRLFVLDNPQGVVDASLMPGAELPIDYEHQADDPARRANGPVPAAGWITELALRDGAIWGRVSWTVKAANMIAAREYRYLSPVLLHRRDGQVTRLLGAGLVHRPNLDLKALASEEVPAPDAARTDALAPIAEALGLNAATAGAGEIVAAIAEARSRPDPARFMPIEAVQELLRSHNEAKAVLSQDRAEGKVRDAMAAGYLTPAMRDWAVALCRQDPDSFDAFLSSAAPAYGHLLGRNGQRPGAVPAVHDAEALAIARNLGLDPSRLLE